MTLALNIILPQKVISGNSLIPLNSSIWYLLPKNSVCVAKSIVAKEERQANALIPIGGLADIFVARLKAAFVLVLSNIPFSVNPDVLLSAKLYFLLCFGTNTINNKIV